MDIVIRVSEHTSGAASYLSSFLMLIREAIHKTRFPWRLFNEHLPTVMISLLRNTSNDQFHDKCGNILKIANITACLDFVFSWKKNKISS